MTNTPPPSVPDITEPGTDMKKGHSKKDHAIAANAQQVKTILLMGQPIVGLVLDGQERLCLAQISNTLLKAFSYNEIHNRRVALGITCVQCTPVQLEILRRAGAMPLSSRRCGMITKREAERLCKSFLTDNLPPKLPDDFTFEVKHECAWGCVGSFQPARYNSSRAKCIKCGHCGLFFSPNKFIFHSHRLSESNYVQPDAANFNSWRRHLKLVDPLGVTDDILRAWEDVKAMFNGGSRKRVMSGSPDAESNSGDSDREAKIPKQMNRAAATVAQDPLANLLGVPPPLPFLPPYSPSFPALGRYGAATPYSLLQYPSALSLFGQPSAMVPQLFSPMTNFAEMTKHTKTLATGADLKPCASTEANSSSRREAETVPGALGYYSTMTKEQLQELLMNEMETRKQLEDSFKMLKGTFPKRSSASGKQAK